MLLLDTSGLLAAIDSSQRHHRECMAALIGAKGPLLLSPFVLAELDYLLARNIGHAAQQALLGEVVRGAYRIEPFDTDDVAAAAEILERFPHIGLADASIVILAERHEVRDILTLDERHFRSLRTRDRKRFRILPADR